MCYLLGILFFWYFCSFRCSFVFFLGVASLKSDEKICPCLDPKDACNFDCFTMSPSTHLILTEIICQVILWPFWLLTPASNGSVLKFIFHMQFLGFLSGEPVVMLFQIKLTVKFKRMLVSVQNLFENGPRWSLFPLLSNLSTFIIGYIVYWQIVLLIPDWIWCCWGVKKRHFGCYECSYSNEGLGRFRWVTLYVLWAMLSSLYPNNWEISAISTDFLPLMRVPWAFASIQMIWNLLFLLK